MTLSEQGTASSEDVTVQGTASSEDVTVPTGTPGLGHSRLFSWLDRSGLPAWQIGVTNFLVLAIIGIVTLVISGFPSPAMYSNVVAFVAIISFFLVFYIEMGRGWYQDLKTILAFDPGLIRHSTIIQPSRLVVNIEVVIAIFAAVVNIQVNPLIFVGFNAVVAVAYVFYLVEWLLVIFSIDLLTREFLILLKFTRSIRINLLQSEVYSVLANAMLRFLKLYIFGMCIITLSYMVFTSGELGFSDLLLIMMPFYLPGLFLMSLFLIPCNQFRIRMQRAKSAELNHIMLAINGNRRHLKSSLIGADADKLSMVDLLYYEDRIRMIKEWPFTDRIRSMLLFGVLPPLTWVIAAFVEILVDKVVS